MLPWCLIQKIGNMADYDEIIINLLSVEVAEESDGDAMEGPKVRDRKLLQPAALARLRCSALRLPSSRHSFLLIVLPFSS